MFRAGRKYRFGHKLVVRPPYLEFWMQFGLPLGRLFFMGKQDHPLGARTPTRQFSDLHYEAGQRTAARKAVDVERIFFPNLA